MKMVLPSHSMRQACTVYCPKSSFSWNTLGFSVAANILLPWKSHFGQLLTRTVHQEVNVIESKTPETDDQAVLYVHWPYCAKRCTYCNFNKYVSESVDHERMAQCLETETRTLLKLSGVKQINSIFFGGGTPSLALPSTIERVINTVRDKVTFKPGSEVTLEANPTKLETERLRDFKTVGVNRVSIGVQALNQNHLNLLGREHTVEQSISCVKKAGALFPGRVSVDVIFGRPKQTLEDWRIELHRVLSFCDDHISLYQLTLEAGTPLYRWVKEKQCELPDSDTMADLYSEAIQILGDHGFERYEVSNFARNGAQCSHNWAYWRGMQYIGVGPGAHGRFSIQDGGGPREARIQTPLPDTWMTEVENRGHGTRKSEPLSNQQRLEEMVILGLRTIEGIPSSWFESQFTWPDGAGQYYTPPVECAGEKYHRNCMRIPNSYLEWYAFRLETDTIEVCCMRPDNRLICHILPCYLFCTPPLRRQR